MLSEHRLPRVKGILTVGLSGPYRGIEMPLKYGGIGTIHICLSSMCNFEEAGIAPQ